MVKPACCSGPIVGATCRDATPREPAVLRLDDAGRLSAQRSIQLADGSDVYKFENRRPIRQGRMAQSDDRARNKWLRRIARDIEAQQVLDDE